MIAKTATMLMLVLLPLVSVAGCALEDRAGASGDGAQTTAGQATRSATVETTGKTTNAESRTGSSAVARAGDAEARAGDGAVARAGSAEGSKGRIPSGDQEPTQEATLKLQGDPHTEFSGSCTIGKEERKFGGRTPKSFHFDPDSGKLECEINKRGTGELRVIFDADGSSSAQSISGAESTVKLLYDGGISISQSSSAGSSE